MCKICMMLFGFFITFVCIAQKNSNPKIGKNELELSLSFFREHRTDYSLQNFGGALIVYRWSWMKNTKIGLGGLVGIQEYDPLDKSDFVPYGAIFGDIAQFIGNKQKWGVNGKLGRGLFKRKLEFDHPDFKVISKHTGGIIYSISFSYRSIISKKILIVVSPVYQYRNIRQKKKEEYYSPLIVYEYKTFEKYSGFGLKLGVVF